LKLGIIDNKEALYVHKDIDKWQGISEATISQFFARSNLCK